VKRRTTECSSSETFHVLRFTIHAGLQRLMASCGGMEQSMCQWLAQPASRNLSCLLQNRQVFTMSKGNTKAQNMTGTLSTESILITVESNWIQTKTVIWFVWSVSFIWFVLFVCLNQTNSMNETNQMNQVEMAHQ